MYNVTKWIVLLGSLIGFGVFAQTPPKRDLSSQACMDCHDDIPEFSHQTPHSPAFEVACEDCHTASAEHIDDPEPSNIVTRGQAAQDRCVACHTNLDHGPLFKNGHHGSKDTTCTDCHSLHKTKQPTERLLAKSTTELCLSCHDSVATSFKKPFTHDVNHGTMNCNSCHDLHSTGAQVGPSFAGQTACASCHQDKAGPFVFEHVSGLSGDCTSCHEPHGSANPKQLTRARVDQLCLECHTTQTAVPTLGSQPPAIHDLRSPRYQNCTTCHTAVHGSHRSPLLLK